VYAQTAAISLLSLASHRYRCRGSTIFLVVFSTN
jgi:hypothetical protein